MKKTIISIIITLAMAGPAFAGLSMEASGGYSFSEGNGKNIFIDIRAKTSGDLFGFVAGVLATKKNLKGYTLNNPDPYFEKVTFDSHKGIYSGISLTKENLDLSVGAIYTESEGKRIVIVNDYGTNPATRFVDIKKINREDFSPFLSVKYRAGITENAKISFNVMVYSANKHDIMNTGVGVVFNF